MTLLFIAGVVVVINAVWPEQTQWHYVAYVIAGLFFIMILQFFRSPARKTQVDDNHIISPADGKIVAIEKIFEDEYLHEERLQLSIFMSPVNVHVNWYPSSGSISYYKYHPGKYLVAWHPKSSTDNERATIVIKHHEHGEILVRQIAGALARRIVTYSTTGENIRQGSEMGFIKFGSRLDVLLPVDAEVKIKLGDSVRGGESILAILGKS